jgi:hypothetical protein
MAHESQSSPASRERDTARILREMKSFAAFDQWMDEQLELLVARWSHAAAPNANRIVRRRIKTQPK